LQSQGAAALSRGQWAEARVWFKRSLAACPTMPSALIGLAIAEKQLGHNKESKRIVDTLLSLGPILPKYERLVPR